MSDTRICAFDGCERPCKSAGLCNTHGAQRRAGRPLTAIRKYSKRAEECSFQDCTRVRRYGDLCNAHGMQRRAGRELTPVRPYVFRDDGGRPVVTRTKRAPKDPTRRDEQGRKRCNTCEGWKSVNDFDRHASRPDGLQATCRRCGLVNHRVRSYRITADVYTEMLANQGGTCAICRRPDPSGRALSVDHDHECCPEAAKSCGKCVRGLLCWSCNVGIGHLRDDPDVLRAAAEYLMAA